MGEVLDLDDRTAWAAHMELVAVSGAWVPYTSDWRARSAEGYERWKRENPGDWKIVKGFSK